MLGPSSNVFFFPALQVAMPKPDTFPRSVTLHFPPSVYQKTGASEILPRLLQIFQPDSLRCVQFLRSAKTRVTFHEKAVGDYHLSEGVPFEDQAISVTRDADKVTVLYLRDCTKWLVRMSLTSSPSMAKFLQWNALSPLTSPICTMGTILSRWSFTKTFRIFSPYVAADAICDVVGNQSSALCVEKLVIGPSPALCLAGAVAVIKWAIWPESVRRSGTQSLL